MLGCCLGCLLSLRALCTGYLPLRPASQSCLSVFHCLHAPLPSPTCLTQLPLAALPTHLPPAQVRATVAARFGSDSNGYLVTENQQEADATDSPAVHIEGAHVLVLMACLHRSGKRVQPPAVPSDHFVLLCRAASNSDRCP